MLQSTLAPLSKYLLPPFLHHRVIPSVQILELMVELEAIDGWRLEADHIGSLMDIFPDEKYVLSLLLPDNEDKRSCTESARDDRHLQLLTMAMCYKDELRKLQDSNHLDWIVSLESLTWQKRHVSPQCLAVSGGRAFLMWLTKTEGTVKPLLLLHWKTHL